VSKGVKNVDAKIVFFFNQGRWGWTETYYWTAPGGTIQAAKADAYKLAEARLPLLNSNCKLEALRVGDQAVNGAGDLVFTGPSNVAQPGGAAQEPWEALLIDLTATGLPAILYHRKVMLRGLPASWNTWTNAAPIQGPANPFLLNSLTGYGRVLRNLQPGLQGRFAIRASNKNVAVSPRTPIVGASLVQPGGYFVVTPAAGPTWAIGQRVHVSKAKGPGTRGMNADAYITAINGGALTLSSRQTCPSTTVSLEGAAVIYPRNYVYPAITTLSADRFVKRDTGRSFFGTRGRQSSAKC